MNDYLDELNESQRAAVLYNDGPSLVIAGAGSGKTRVLTYKIAHLMNIGYDPWNILALTFTNKAAREMKERITRQVGERARYLWMGTFHSIFSRILRIESQALGFSSNFTIYDASDSKSLLKSIIKEKFDEAYKSLTDEEKDKYLKYYKVNLIQSRISNAKNQLIVPSVYMLDDECKRADRNDNISLLGEIYECYWERCRQDNVMDFDDLLLYTYILFRDNPEIRLKYALQFRYILVDEYQDTNCAQNAIILQLTTEYQRICVVGDDAQSIYSFRGAKIENILNFTKNFVGAKLYRLEQNYRSTQTIVGAANSLIKNNVHQIPKNIFSKNSQGDLIEIAGVYSDYLEGDFVARKIEYLHSYKKCSYEDFVVLYRANAQSRIIEETLRKNFIPYRVYGGLSFYQHKEIKDVLAYCRMAINPDDGEAFKRILNYPARGIGNVTLEKLLDASNAFGKSLWSILKDPISYGLNFNKGTTAKLQKFRELIEAIMAELNVKRVDEIGKTIIELSGIKKHLSLEKEEDKVKNVDELLKGMQDFCRNRYEEGDERVGLVDYMAEVALLTDQDMSDKEDFEKVTLMTIHSAKGLEFKKVFIVGLEEGIFPSEKCLHSETAIEEERRLFYVAITRAEECCYISYAENRSKYGTMEFSSYSRFLEEIDECYIDWPKKRRRMLDEGVSRFRASQTSSSTARSPFVTRSQSLIDRYAERPAQPASAPVQQEARRFKKVSTIPSSRPSASPSVGGLQAGAVIEHERFGVGDVISVVGTGDNCKATVRFRNAGEKQLLLKFARFKVIG